MVAIRMAALVGVLSTAVNAQSLELATSPFAEELRPAAQISGALVTGVLQQGPLAGALNVEAFIPAAWAGQTLCNRVISHDGFYEAANEYSVPADWSGGFDTVPYPTRYEGRLQEVADLGLGMRMSLGTCDRPSDELTLARWNHDGGARIALLMNSFQAEAVFAYVGNTLTPVRCGPVTLAGRSAYDTLCALDLTAHSGPTEVELLRIDDGKAAPPVPLTVWLP